jgi:hypothetical protein
MSKVSAISPARQVERAEDHPPQRSGAGGAEGTEPGLADGPLSPQTTPPPLGLVPSRTTARVVPLTLERQADSVAVAARSFGGTPWLSLAEESPLPRLKIAPGVLVLTRTSVAQDVRTAELEHVRQVAKVNVAGQFLAEDPDWRLKGLPGREVTEWSAQSRSNMVRTFASLDWSPVVELDQAGRIPAMVTLTYPGAWEIVAPDGKTVKQHVRVLLLRYKRAWSESVIGAWKLEFQGRGAPHVHIFMAPPHGRARGRGVGAGLSFTHWLSAVWADVVDHPDAVEYMKHLAAGTGVDHVEALKCSDPKRLAVYFGKHGQYRDKEYQNQVPEAWQAPGKGPGRFWGYWGLKPLVAAVELRPGDYELAARILRRYAERARVWDKAAGEWKYVRAMYGAKGSYAAVDYATGEIGWRKHRRRSRVRRFTSCSGFLLVNNGPAMATQLARAIEVCRT